MPVNFFFLWIPLEAVDLCGHGSVHCIWHSSVAKSLSLSLDRTFAGPSDHFLPVSTEPYCRYAFIAHWHRDKWRNICMNMRNLFSCSSFVSFTNCITSVYNHCYISVRQSRNCIILSCPSKKILYMIVQGKSCVFVSLPRVEIWCYGYLWKKIIFLPLSYEDAHNYRLQISSFSMTWWPYKAFWVCCSKISNSVFCLKVNWWII